MPRVLEILSNILNPIEYSYGSTEVSTNYPTFSIAYSIYSILQYSLLVVVNLLRSDDLLYPDYGRSAIGAERPILFPSTYIHIYNTRLAFGGGYVTFIWKKAIM